MLSDPSSLGWFGVIKTKRKRTKNQPGTTVFSLDTPYAKLKYTEENVGANTHREYQMSLLRSGIISTNLASIPQIEKNRAASMTAIVTNIYCQEEDPARLAAASDTHWIRAD